MPKDGFTSITISEKVEERLEKLKEKRRKELGLTKLSYTDFFENLSKEGILV